MKEVKNGKGTNLNVREGAYISVGKDGNNVMLRANGKVMAFDTFEAMVAAIDDDKAAYVQTDK